MSKKKISDLRGVGILGNQSAKEINEQLKELRDEWERSHIKELQQPASGIDWDFYEEEKKAIKQSIKEKERKIYDWVEDNLKRIGLSKDSHPALIMGRGLTIERTIKDGGLLRDSTEVYMLYEKGRAIARLTLKYPSVLF